MVQLQLFQRYRQQGRHPSELGGSYVQTNLGPSLPAVSKGTAKQTNIDRKRLGRYQKDPD